ncbi:hypothetical protein RJ55_02459 [Drechmeria coniospora]|nr:hypothetical protein RJ55_02459 [Drechmeria coniospora]
MNRKRLGTDIDGFFSWANLINAQDDTTPFAFGASSGLQTFMMSRRLVSCALIILATRMRTVCVIVINAIAIRNIVQPIFDDVKPGSGFRHVTFNTKDPRPSCFKVSANFIDFVSRHVGLTHEIKHENVEALCNLVKLLANLGKLASSPLSVTSQTNDHRLNYVVGIYNGLL